jgi:hypothetical protein
MQSACAVLYCHLWPVWLYHIFIHYLINSTILGKKLLNIKCVFRFYLQILSETFLILRRIQRDIIYSYVYTYIIYSYVYTYIIYSYVYTSSRPLFLSDFNETWIFSTDFRKNPQTSNLMKLRPAGAELFHGDRRTDMVKLVVAFRNFVKGF